MTAYRVHFPKLGRGGPYTLETKAADADELAFEVHKWARPKLASRDVEASVRLDTMEAFVTVGGLRLVGTGSIELMSDSVL